MAEDMRITEVEVRTVKTWVSPHSAEIISGVGSGMAAASMQEVAERLFESVRVYINQEHRLLQLAAVSGAPIEGLRDRVQSLAEMSGLSFEQAADYLILAFCRGHEPEILVP